MGLSKLLAVSRSLRSVTEEPSRYKMTQQNLLPSFGGAKAAEARAVEVVPPAGEATPKPGKADLAKEAKAASETMGAAQSEPKSAKVAAFLEATKKLRPFGGGSWFKNPFARTTARKPARVPVQAELSLDSVRPVRNELNDPEVELGRPPRCAPEPESPTTPAVVPAAPVAATGGLWQRLKTRLFGANDEI